MYEFSQLKKSEQHKLKYQKSFLLKKYVGDKIPKKNVNDSSRSKKVKYILNKLFNNQMPFVAL